MRTLRELLDLDRSLRDMRVLSVYLSGTEADPAKQHAWHVDLGHGLNDVRKGLVGSSHAEREEFERCAEVLSHKFQAFAHGIGAYGYAAFITRDGVREASVMPVPVPTRITWSSGLSLAPYVSALSSARPVIIALVDSTRADVFRYRLGVLERVASIKAHHAPIESSHMGDAPRSGFHSGTRGDTGHDAAQRTLREGTKRMLGETADYLLRVAGADGWIVTGGIPQESQHLADRVRGRAPGRVWRADALDIHSTAAAVAHAARTAAATLRERAEQSSIDDVIDQSGSGGLGTLGPATTHEALDQGNVAILFVTETYLGNHVMEAEEAVRSVLGQGGSIESISGAAARTLDEHGGMAARLRYRLIQPALVSP